MSRIGKVSVLVVLLVGIAAGTIIGMNLTQPVVAQAGGGGAIPAAHHSVVMTDGTHLVVTDNKTDTLYFYSIDKDAAIGSELRLRGKADLSQVGKDVITPVIMFKKEK